MSDNIESILSEIEFLIARKNVAKRGLLPKNKYIDLLIQIKTQYGILASLYMQKGENLFAFQALLCSADILFEVCELEPKQIRINKLDVLLDRLTKITADCYDLNLNRRAFVAIGHLNYYLGNYIVAEEYIQKAFDDFDYSMSTFQLYIKVLDKQRKYEKMLTLTKEYLTMSPGFHDKCSLECLSVPNILHSLYAPAYKELFY